MPNDLPLCAVLAGVAALFAVLYVAQAWSSNATLLRQMDKHAEERREWRAYEAGQWQQIVALREELARVVAAKKRAAGKAEE
jgi:hypothetical protein